MANYLSEYCLVSKKKKTEETKFSFSQGTLEFENSRERHPPSRQYTPNTGTINVTSYLCTIN